MLTYGQSLCKEKYLMATKVLVTGADGFIGSHLTEALVRQGFETKAFVMYNSYNKWGWLDNVGKEVSGQFEVFSGDIRDPHGVMEACRGADVILHLAALIAIPFSYISPDAYIQTNITGTLNILQAARHLGIQKIVSTSTSETYGTAQFVPITEQHPLNAQSPYSASKIGADQLALSFHRSFDLPISILRPFNTYGPRQSARAVIPTIISQIASGANEINLGNMLPTRDFTFVQDTAEGFIQTMLCEEAVGEVINLGSGFEISIKETVETISEIMDKKIEVVEDKKRFRPVKSEVERLYACTQKAEKLLQWKPYFSGYSGFQNGLRETIKWFENPANLASYKTTQYNI